MKINELRKAIDNNDQNRAIELVDELYNAVRDFSQAIEFKVEANETNLTLYSNTTAQWAKTKKEEVQKWVGGH